MRSGLEVQTCEPRTSLRTVFAAMGVDRVSQGIGDPLATLKDFILKSLLPLIATTRDPGELFYYLHGFVL